MCVDNSEPGYGSLLVTGNCNFAIEMNEVFISITFIEIFLTCTCFTFALQKSKDENFNGVPGKYLPQSVSRRYLKTQSRTGRT